jgi:hypothetical protein
MHLEKLEEAHKEIRAAANEAGGKVTGAKRRLKAAKKGVRVAKAEVRKARKLLREAKAEARRAEKQARKNERKLFKALKISQKPATHRQKTGPKNSARRRRTPVQVDLAAANSPDVIHSPVANEPPIQAP